jgi:adenylate kinase
LSAVLSRPLRIVLIGPPASGKGTQGRRLAAELGLNYLSTGALLREQVEQGSPLGKLAEPILARGEYLPDELMCSIVGDWLSRQTDGWVSDGFPRSLPQAKYLAEWLGSRGMQLDAAISLEAPFEVLLTRIESRVECPGCRWSGRLPQLRSGRQCPECDTPASRRADDSEENFRCRYASFVTLTQPILDFYREAGVLSPCEAMAPQDEVAARLLRLFPDVPV